MFKYVFIVFVFTFLTSCFFSNKKEHTGQGCTILINNAENTSFFALVDSAFFLELDTAGGYIIGEITHLIIDKEILVVDKNNNLFTYSNNGVPIHKLSDVGNGPGEYVSINGIIPMEKGFYILDIMQNKILHYSKDWIFLRDKKIPIDGLGGVGYLQKDNSYVFEKSINSSSKISQFNLFVLDENMTIKNKFLPYSNTSSIILPPRNKFYTINDTLVYVPTYSNLIYNIFSNHIEERCKFDFAEHWMDYSYLYDGENKENPMDFIYGLQNKNFVYFLNITESTTHFCLDFWCGNKQYFYIINKITNADNIIKSIDIYGFDLKGKPLTTHGEYFIFVVNQGELHELFASDKHHFNGYDVAKKVYENFGDDKNQLLMFIKFK